MVAISVRPRERRCEAMTLCCRPRAGGDPYAPARRCDRASDDRNLGVYGSPPARGRQRPGSCQGQLSTLDARLRGSQRSVAYALVLILVLLAIPNSFAFAHGIGGKDASFVA